MANMAELVTIPNVELCETGVDWPASTGPVTFTADDLLSAAEAPYNDPAIKLPRMRFGHTSATTSMEDSAMGIKEQPCVGKFTNLRVENEGNLLVADLVGVPRWLADILPTAYPNRSVEAFFEVSTNTGRKHKMVITSVALLGEHLPGVQTLEDLEYLFSDEPTEWINALEGKQKVAASQSQSRGDQTVAKRVAASVDTSDVRSAFYDQVATEESGRYYWWLHQMYLDPSVCIAEDETMEYWLISYSATASGITFDEPVKVKIQWAEEESGNVLASMKLGAAQFGHAQATWASAEDSRPAVRQAEIKTKEAKPAMGIDIPALRERLELTEDQLPDDATEEQINAAIAGEVTSEGDDGSEGTEGSGDEPVTEGTEGESEGDEGDSGEVDTSTPEAIAAALASGNVVIVDKDTWEQTRSGAKAGLDLSAKAERQSNRSFLESAVRKGKIPRAAMASYEKQMNGPSNDGRGPARAAIKEMISKLEEGVVAPIEEVGHSDAGETSNGRSAQAGTGLFPELEQRRAALTGAEG